MADEPDFTITPCSACNETSTEDELLVGCDYCKRWFHARCVNFNAADKKPGKKWYCPDKECQKNKKKTKKSVDEPLPVPPETQEKLKALEEARKRAEAEQEAALILTEKEMEAAIFLEERKLAKERELRERMARKAEALREKEFELRQAELEAESKRKEEHLKRIQDLEATFREKNASIDKLLKNSSTPLRNPDVKPLTKENVEKLEGEKKPGGEANPPKTGDGSGDSDSKSTESSASESSASESSSRKSSSIGGDDGDESKGGAKSDKSANAEKGKVSKKKPDGLGQHGSGPTKAQRAARQGLTRKLPDFYGKPEEWPLFFAAYQASNEACGYTDVENLVRLQDCLKSKALEEVRGQLILPKSVPRIIAKLRQLYGRPELLLQSHLQKVRKLEPPRADRLATYIPFGNAVEQLCEHIEAAELTAHLVNPILIQELVDKLPDGEKRSWVHYKRKRRNVDLRTFTNFLSKIVEDACDANVSLDYKTDGKAASGSSGRSRHREKAALYNHSEVESSPPERREQKQPKPCKVCQRTDHRLWNCEDFKQLPYEDRVKVVKKWKLCQRCLNEHGGQCKTKFRCNVGECREPHSPLLHPESRAVGMSAHITSTSPVLFRMLPVKVYCGERSMIVLAFLDEGSSLTLIEGGLADRLGLLGMKEKLTIKWTANITRVEQHSRRTNLWASAIDGANGEKLLLQSVRTVDKLMLPHQKLKANEMTAHYKHLRGVSVESYDGRPGMLIGLNNIHAFAPMETKVGTVVDPVAVRCKLGWTVYGPRDAESADTSCFLGCHQEVTNEELHDLLKSHYALEEAVVTVPRESVEDQRARRIMEDTTRRVGNRFETGLLWKTDDVKFPNSYPMAVKRMKQLEKRLERSPELYDNVRKQLQEYQAKGYAHVATAEELSETNKAFYLPLSVVVNPKKPGKVRLVWDAAAAVHGVSLNSMLVKGPDLLVPLVSVICGFRERRIAFGGDIREMYHQLKIIDADKQAQRFVFRNNTNGEPTVFVMDVATFGSKSSPASAQFIKNRNAEEHAVEYPEAAAAIINRHYVDDYFDSVDTIEEAVTKAKQVSHVHKQGGFEIRNWVSNSPEVLTALGEEKPMTPVLINQDKQTPSERVLGVRWDPEMDEFAFAVMHREELIQYLKEGKRPTKRIVLSCVMGFFDPLGLLSPFTIHGKIVIQHLWRTGCRWDQEIDDEAWILWKRWTALLPEVEALRFPRSYFGDAMSSSVESLELHIFSDASELAYGCAAYLRAVIDGEVHCSLVMARSKVAPLKRQSIPRLELMAACMGARMSQQILGTHTLQIDRTVLWTDSRTVLAWLHADPYKYKQFVAFRVGEILELTRLDDWRWVPSKKNIADVLTKWGPGPPLQNESEWRNGPAILFERDNHDLPPVQIEETSEEARGLVLCHGTVDVEAISTWAKLVRVTATAARFIANCRRKKDGRRVLAAKVTIRQAKLVKAHYEADELALQQDELQKAERFLWKQAQFESFPDEVSVLTKNLQLQPGESPEKLERSSALYKLLPVLDEDGVLRVRGRLEKNGSIPFDKRFPIILDRKHAITKKLIQHYHEKFGHASRETVFNELRQKFWIPNARAAIREVAKECVWCRVNRCVPNVPTMAPLPVERTAISMRPFSAVGVDYLPPEAAAAIINRHYVDDYFDSVDTIEEAVTKAKQVSHVHKQGGFEIRNWVSNSPEVLTALGEEKPMTPVLINQDKQTPSERVLGVRWDPEMDEFAFAVMHREELIQYLKEGKRPTKRIVLSCVMGFFDPLGLLSPFTIHGKIVIQHLWRTGCRWDQEIDDEAWILWKRWTALLPEVEALRFPRSYFGDAMSSSVESLELHIFSDASELAYGCAAYLRAVIDGEVHCSLVMARSKVAPLKRQSIPRLELMAACMGARMSQQILGTHTLQIDRTVLWTDSRTVLAWLHADPYKYKQFVAFRVGEILELTRLDDWRWVPSKKNIADVLTKWGPGPPLQNESEWRNGPAILFERDNHDLPPVQIEETSEEARGLVLCHGTVDVEAISTWAKLVRVTATAARFIANCRRKKDGRRVLAAKVTIRQAKLVKAHYEADELALQQDELQKAERFLWKQAQFESFPDEVSVLTKNLQLQPGESPEKLERSSALYKLLPVLDEDGVLRVRGRLEKNGSIPFDKRFPIILDRKHAITKKLIQHYHEKFGHASRETVFNELRQKFWIPNARAAIREVAKECVWCRVNRCVPNVPTMAPLPVERTAISMRPFSAVGVDYLGPVEVTVGRRKEKRWIAVFTCLAIRAVHLEVVHSLTTQSCLMALRRFACKRGVPEKVFSDNATCFRGADSAMTKEINKECAEKMTSSTTAWSFIPPGTPHMGGAWERMVRSVKEALRALDDGRKLTDEILSTSLAEAEDMINTRPLTYVPQESAEEEAITPNHFLRGTVTSADLKADETLDYAATLRDVYKRSQHLATKMWERWSKEYLPSLNRRPKWFEDRKSLEVGDLVFVVDGNRKSWKRGQVEELFRASDGRVRQANVRTADGKVNRRAVVNLAVLEIRDGKSDERESPPDVTGWGVATAKLGALPDGATPAV